MVEGLELRDADGELLAFSVQYHPEAAAGPHDASYLFDRFIDLMAAQRRQDRHAGPTRSSPRGGAPDAAPDRHLQSILVIGSGPIVIGQACEFDYSGTQACRVLMAEGFRVILVNSNPATIMTDPEFADATYIEPITPEFVEQVIAKERPDALLATLGGQTALNVAVALHESGVLEKYGVELIGASIEAIQRGENREQFKAIVERSDRDRGRPCRGGPAAASATRWTTCSAAADELGYPLVVRPSFTMGGVGSGFAHDEADLRRIAGAGLAASPTTEVLIEESILGWKEYELEVMRDRADNVVIVCSIENLDPMGVHTGDSITVAPAMTLTDREYQRMRDVAIAHHPRRRRGHRRLQHPVRDRPGDRPDDRDRDEPAGLPLQRAGAQGDRLPDRQDRRQGRRSATPSTRSPTTSPARRRPASSRPWTTSWSRCRGSRSRSSRPPTPP